MLLPPARASPLIVVMMLLQTHEKTKAQRALQECQFNLAALTDKHHRLSQRAATDEQQRAHSIREQQKKNERIQLLQEQVSQLQGQLLAMEMSMTQASGQESQMRQRFEMALREVCLFGRL